MPEGARKCCVTSKNLRHAPLRRIALPCAKLLMQMFCGLGSNFFWQKVIRQKFTKKEDGKKKHKRSVTPAGM